MYRRSFLSACFIILASACTADVITVNWDGSADYTTIQPAIDAAMVGDEVIVAQGIYVENINFGGKNIVLTSLNPIDPNIVETTVIDGGGLGSVVTFAGTEDPNCILTGFTITNGHNTNGGGINGENTDATISNCIVINNRADDDGGGLHRCYGLISYCTIMGNITIHGGGGLSICNGKIENSVISGNTANNCGGGMYNKGSSSPTVTDCTFSDNLADMAGGGMFNWSGNPTVTNCTFSDNSAIWNCGGGMYNYDESSPTVINCTFSGNSAGFNAGGMYNDYSSSPTVTNCILWGDTPDEIQGTATVSYSDVEGDYIGMGNIDEDPLFVDRGTGDYHLMWSSPCINAGDPNYVPEEGDVDIDGEPRLMGVRVDMGADEVGPKQADFTRNGRIDIEDFVVFSRSWDTQPTEGNWYILCDLFDDDIIDINDLAAFADDWLWHANWY